MSSSSVADSYIGSVISLTSKFEIRYEGVLCSLNPDDSTLGLKNVKSYGTEGRKRDGPEIPPNDKVYEYILFRGSDVKDLQVKSSPPPVEESIHSDPAIIESQFASENPVSSKPVALNNGPVFESGPYQESSEVKTNFYSGLAPQNVYNPQANYPSNSLSADWTGHGVSVIHNSYAGQRPPVLSNATNFPVTSSFSQTQFSNFVASIPSLSSSNTLNPYSMPTYPPLVTGNALNTVVLSSAGMDSANVESINFNEKSPYPPLMQPSQSLSYGGSSTMNSMTGGFLITPNQLSQTRLSEFPPAPVFCPDEGKMPPIVSSTAAFSSSSFSTQGPLPPLHHPSTEQFTEEFDFEAMNQKFNKNEVWGLLGSTKLNDKGERIDDKDAISQLKVNGLMPAADSKPAYNKDDFFDSISCNSTSHRGRIRQNHYSDRMRPDSRIYDDYQQRPNQESGGYGGGRGPYHPRGSYGWGRGGYNSGGRGRGGYVQW